MPEWLQLLSVIFTSGVTSAGMNAFIDWRRHHAADKLQEQKIKHDVVEDQQTQIEKLFNEKLLLTSEKSTLIAENKILRNRLEEKDVLINHLIAKEAIKDKLEHDNQ